MKRYIKSGQYHIDDNPELPEIPDFEDFCKYFTNPKKFGKKMTGDPRDKFNDVETHPTWEDLYGQIDYWYIGNAKFLGEGEFWGIAEGANGIYGLAFFSPEESYCKELYAGEGFERCLLDNKSYITDYLRETAYISFREGI